MKIKEEVVSLVILMRKNNVLTLFELGQWEKFPYYSDIAMTKHFAEWKNVNKYKI